MSDESLKRVLRIFDHISIREHIKKLLLGRRHRASRSGGRQPYHLCRGVQLRRVDSSGLLASGYARPVLYSCFSLLTRKTTASATTVSRSFRQPSVARIPIRVRRCARSTFPVRLVLPVDRRQRHHVDGRHLHQQAHSPHRRHCLRSV